MSKHKKSYFKKAFFDKNFQNFEIRKVRCRNWLYLEQFVSLQNHFWSFRNHVTIIFVFNHMFQMVSIHLNHTSNILILKILKFFYQNYLTVIIKAIKSIMKTCPFIQPDSLLISVKIIEEKRLKGSKNIGGSNQGLQTFQFFLKIHILGRRKRRPINTVGLQQLEPL